MRGGARKMIGFGAQETNKTILHTVEKFIAKLVCIEAAEGDGRRRNKSHTVRAYTDKWKSAMQLCFFFSFADGPLSTANLHKEGRGFSARYRQQPTEQRWVRARTHCVSCHTKFGGALCTKQDDHRRAGIEVRHAIRAAAFAEKSFISRTQVLWSLQFVSSRCSSLCIWLFWGMDWWARVTSEKRFRRGRRNKELLANRARIYYMQRACLCNSLSSFQINGLCAEKLSVFFLLLCLRLLSCWKCIESQIRNINDDQQEKCITKKT